MKASLTFRHMRRTPPWRNQASSAVAASAIAPTSSPQSPPAGDHTPLAACARGGVPPSIWTKTNANLHMRPLHPLDTLRRAVTSHLHDSFPSLFSAHTLTKLSPLVSVSAAFDDLLVPPSHPSRRPSDTFYVSPDVVLRPHMTAHDAALLRHGVNAAVLCGDVFRRDTVDRTHYPVFHQLDAFRLHERGTAREAIERELKHTLESLARTMFGQGAQLRWVDASFPFTTPSFELEVLWHGEWLELLGCGLLHRGVLSRAGVADDVDGWAFGLGLERLAMVLFDIPDIRLFWSSDERFHQQFASGSLRDRFRPFSAYPPVEKHVAFWVDGAFCENDLCQTVRSVASDLVEDIALLDRFQKDGRTSLCFRIVFRSLERSLTHMEVNELYERVRAQIGETLPVTLR